MDPMGATIRGIFYTIAVICFIVAAVAHPKLARVNWVAVGLGFFVFVFAWDAWALS